MSRIHQTTVLFVNNTEQKLPVVPKQNGKVEMQQSRRSSTLLLFARFGDCARQMPFHPPLVFKQAYNYLLPEPEPTWNQSQTSTELYKCPERS